MSRDFHLFVYGAMRGASSAATALEGGERVAATWVAGTLYDTGAGYPALVLAGSGRVHGEIWRCPVALLWALDQHAGVDERLFRRVGVRVGDQACWTYVAGPGLVRRLTPENRIASGRWGA